MGLTLHYNGRFDKLRSLEQMIEEVEDIVNIHKWKFNVYERNFPDNDFNKEEHNNKVYGISFTPLKCETVSLCFLSNGRMSCPSLLNFYGNSSDEAEQKYLYMVSVKTQYAGVQVHQFIVHLLRYLSGKYFSELNVKDEGGYWQTGDVELLKRKFEQYNKLLSSVSTTLETFPVNKDESMKNYIERMLLFINKQT